MVSKIKKPKKSHSAPSMTLNDIEALDGHASDMDLLNHTSDSELEQESMEMDRIKDFMKKELKMEIREPAKTRVEKTKNLCAIPGDSKTLQNQELQKSSKKSVDSQSQEPRKESKKKSLETKKEISKTEKMEATTRIVNGSSQIQQLQPATAESNSKKSLKTMVEPTTLWHDIKLDSLDVSAIPTANHPKIAILLKKAQDLWDADVKTYESTKKMSLADKEFVSTILKSGTVSDKVSALTLLVQESPIHQFKHLRDDLFHGMALKKSRREAIMAMDSIKDLLVGTLLPDRKLKYFCDQPLLAKNVTSNHLIVWIFEDALKRLYFEFIQLLEVRSHQHSPGQQLSMDPLLFVKTKMMTYIYDLLRAKPEEEQNLLTLLVNKMGDQERKIASKTTHLLSQLLHEHPAMKLIVIKEVERLLFRANVAEKAKYYAIIFLNQIVLSNRPDDKVASNYMIQLYFSVFEGLVPQIKHSERAKGTKKVAKKEASTAQADGINVKVMGGLLTGVNRAFPYSSIDDDVFEKHIATLFTICHLGTFTTSIQALSLIFQVQSTRQTLSDRFYRVLYEMLLDARLLTSSKQAMFMNLLFKSLKNDASMTRSFAFIKRLVQVCAYAQIPFVCASLFLIGEMFKLKPGLTTLVSTPEEEDDDEKFVDVLDDEDQAKVIEAAPAKSETVTKQGYDGKKRDPLYCNADKSCLWELQVFATHFHPTISLYAAQLLQGAAIPVPKDATNYDPLTNHTLTKFLDRFVYKNPKKHVVEHKGTSLMQPRVNGKQEQPLNTLDWTNKDQSNVPVDEIFFLQYFQDKERLEGSKKKKSDKKEVPDSDDSDGTDEAGLDEDEIWEAMNASSGFPSELKEPGDEDVTFEDLDSEGEEDALDVPEDALESDEDEEQMDPAEMEAQFREMDGLDIEEVTEESGDDSDMDKLFQGEPESSSDDEQADSSSRKKGKPSRAIERLAQKAKSKGYTGSYFSQTKPGSKLSDFAEADDFMDMIDRDLAESQDEDEIVETPQKRRKHGSKMKPKRRRV